MLTTCWGVESLRDVAMTYVPMDQRAVSPSLRRGLREFKLDKLPEDRPRRLESLNWRIGRERLLHLTLAARAQVERRRRGTAEHVSRHAAGGATQAHGIAAWHRGGASARQCDGTPQTDASAMARSADDENRSKPEHAALYEGQCRMSVLHALRRRPRCDANDWHGLTAPVRDGGRARRRATRVPPQLQHDHRRPRDDGAQQSERTTGVRSGEGSQDDLRDVRKLQLSALLRSALVV